MVRTAGSLALLSALMVISVAPAASASETRSIPASKSRANLVTFPVKGVLPSSVISGRVKIGSYRQTLRAARLRAAARRGALRIRLPRSYRKRALRVRLRQSVSRKHARLSLKLRSPTESPISSSPAPAVSGFLGGFDSGHFTEFDGWAAVSGSLVTSTERAYEGTHSATATNDGSLNNSFQRVQQPVDWATGSDIWYGMALYIPRLTDWCWWNPIRWDNHKTYGSAGDVGGLRIEQGKLYLDQAWYGGAENQLIGPLTIPEARWFWLEVHQKLSGTHGDALSEIYIDGQRAGSSTRANTAGRVVNHIRFGNVSLASQCSRAASINIDRISITNGPRGPLH